MKSTKDSDARHLFLELAAVRKNGDRVEALIKGDKSEPSPLWLEIGTGNDTFKAVSEALDKKRAVHVTLGGRLKVEAVTIYGSPS